MKIKSISFENYKAFAEKQTMQLNPITILIGKNSSGKSSIAKLFPLLENSLSGLIDEPLLINNNGVELGAEFRDLVYGKDSTPIKFEIEYVGDKKLKVQVIQDSLNYKLDILEWEYDDFPLKYFREGGYSDWIGNTYHCEFKGFVPSKMKDLLDGNKLIELNPILNIDVDYIGPFRVLPKRQFYLSGKIKFRDTGIKGENAYSMLGVSKRMDSNLHEKVALWYEKNFDGWRLEVKDNNPYFEVSLNKEKASVNIVDVGQGMNQALPLIVRANVTDRPDSLIVLEQPELHLHPAAHGDLAELFAKSAKENSQTFVIETHSENIILRLRKLIIENDFGFTKDDLVIYSVESGEYSGQALKEITVNEEGVLSDWPEGVFNENVKEILEMQKALNSKK